MFLAAKYPHQAGVPVTGTYDDGPEWGTQPYTNMFASDKGSVDPKYPVNTQIGDFLKEHGGTVLGSYGYGDLAVVEPGGHRHGRLLQARRGQGRRARHDRPLRRAWTSPAWPSSAKQDGINAMVPAMDANSNYALAHGAAAGRRQAQGGDLRHRLPARRDQLPGLEGAAGRLLLLAVPALVPAQRRDPADAGGHGEVRALHQEPVPDVRPVRVLGRCRPHDQGPADGRGQPDAGGGHQGPARPQVLQRQRPAARRPRLRHQLRAQPARRRAPGSCRHSKNGVHADLVEPSAGRTCRARRRRPRHSRQTSTDDRERARRRTVRRRAVVAADSAVSAPVQRRRHSIRSPRKASWPFGDVFEVGAQRDERRHLGQRLTPSELVGHPDGAERCPERRAPGPRRWPGPPTWPAPSALRAARLPRPAPSGGPAPPTCARVRRGAATRRASPSGSFCSRWIDSNPATIPYVTCGSKKVACSAAMMMSHSPKR